MKIAYSALVKNPKRRKAPYYGRIRQDGKEKFIPLNTESKAEAMKWVERQKNILFQVNEFLEAGQQVPDDLMAKLVTVDTPAFAQKGASKPVSAPGGILERWEVDMRVRGLSGATIANYVKAAHIVLGDARLDTLGADAVREAISRNLGIGNNTRRFYCNALRSLFRFLGREDLCRALPKIRPVEGDHVFWSHDEMYDICCTVSSDTPERTEQYRLYFFCLMESACRNSELMNVKWKDIDQASIRFSAGSTKARKERVVPISWRLYAELDVIRQEPEQYVFNLVSRNQSRRYKVLARAVRKLGLPTGGLHTFRRSRATEIYRRCGIAVASRMVGDSEAIALKHYIKEAGIEELRKEVFWE